MHSIQSLVHVVHAEMILGGVKQFVVISVRFVKKAVRGGVERQRCENRGAKRGGCGEVVPLPRKFLIFFISK